MTNDDRWFVLGADPGHSGAVTYWDGINDPHCYPLKEMTPKDICDLLKEYSPKTKHAALEQVHSMPKQGVASVWTFSGSYHCLLMGLYAFEYKFNLVRPQAWQKSLGCMSGGDKNVTKACAQRLFPTVKCNHAISDSMLIAYYALNYLNNNNS